TIAPWRGFQIARSTGWPTLARGHRGLVLQPARSAFHAADDTETRYGERFQASVPGDLPPFPRVCADQIPSALTATPPHQYGDEALVAVAVTLHDRRKNRDDAPARTP